MGIVIKSTPISAKMTTTGCVPIVFFCGSKPTATVLSVGKNSAIKRLNLSKDKQFQKSEKFEHTARTCTDLYYIKFQSFLLLKYQVGFLYINIYYLVLLFVNI